MNNSIILITGGTGTFGSAFIERCLINHAKEIRIFSRDEAKQALLAQNYKKYPQIKFYIGDIKDKDSLELAMTNVDYVFHAAAMKHVPICEKYPLEALKTNVIGSDNVLSLAIKHKVKKVILNMKTDCYEDRVISLDAQPDIEVGSDSCYIYENGFLMTKDKETVVYYSGKGKVVVPEGVKTIRKDAFSWSDVTEVLLPYSLTTIENGAFTYSQKLSKVVLRSALKVLGERAFKGCKSLKTIDFSDSYIEFNDNTNSSWYVFDGCDNLSEIILPPMNYVPDYMFDQCKNLKSVVISEGTKKINDNVFTKTPKLEKLYIPDSVTTIGSYAFQYCSALSTIKLPAGMTSISNYTFADSYRTCFLGTASGNNGDPLGNR